MTIYCEASSEPPAVWDAIAHVILNRVAIGRWGDTVAQVCLSPYQFSEWLPDKADAANMRRACHVADDDPIWLGCLKAYDTATSSADPTSGATHFYDDRIPAPSWTARATFTVQLGTTRFYANVA